MRRPLILVTPSTGRRSIEFGAGDHSISLGSRYLEAVIDAGGLAVALPLTTDPATLGELVARSDGVMLTGGDDLDPHLYWPDVPSELLAKCECAEPARDRMELLLVEEVFRRQKPLFAICRGHQLVNVAAGGKLVVDIATQRPDALGHCRMDRKHDIIHDVSMPADSLLAAICGTQTLGVNSTHHQAVAEVGRPFRSAAESTDGVIEATELRPEDRGLLPWYLSVQFHPERLRQTHPEHAALFAAFVAACRTYAERT
jgi:putative glutamine amidotransferase